MKDESVVTMVPPPEPSDAVKVKDRVKVRMRLLEARSYAGKAIQEAQPPHYETMTVATVIGKGLAARPGLCIRDVGNRRYTLRIDDEWELA